MSKLYGTITFESDRIIFAFVLGPLAQTISVTYQDAIDCESPVVLERQAQTIKFVGSIAQFRKLRRRLAYFVFDGLLPLANQIPFDAEIHAKVDRESDEESEDGRPSPSRDKPPSQSKKASKSTGKASARESQPKKTPRSK